MAKKKENDGRKISRDVLEAYRLRAIELRKKKWSVNSIAESFGLHRGSISRWFTKHQRGGIKALKKRKAPGARSKLEDKEVEKLLSCLKQPATAFGFETPLWNCNRVRQLIKSELRTELDVSNVWRMLRSWNFTPQIPTKTALEQNPYEVKKWLMKEWPKIRAHARRWQAVLYFQDESGVSLTPVLGKTWAPKGKTPFVKVTGNRGGLCITSAITNGGHMVFRIEKEKINGSLHVEFLEQIIKHHPQRKVIVIEDRAPPHRAKIVENFVQKNKKRFALYHIPSYSPELNPDEKVWGYLKGNKLKTHLAQSTGELKKLVFSKMKSIQKQPKIIKSFFYDSYVT